MRVGAATQRARCGGARSGRRALLGGLLASALAWAGPASAAPAPAEEPVLAPGPKAGELPAPDAATRPAARLQVVTTLPILAELVLAIGGERVEVQALADPRQNPHFVEPRPTLMQRARKAQVFVEVGLQLEPWARRVIVGSGNAAIQYGEPGHIVSARGVTTLEVPAKLTREEGNIHPYGNPYVWLDPLNLRRMAENVAAGLAEVDPKHADDYAQGLETYVGRLDRALFGDRLVAEVGGAKLDRLARQQRLAGFLEQRELSDQLGGWLGRAAPLAGHEIVSYHTTWPYLAQRFGFEVAAEIEEKPGIPPSARHRERVLELVRQRDVRTLLIESYQDRRAAEWIATRSQARILAVPIDVGPEVGVADYFELIDRILEPLLAMEAGH